MSRISRTSSIGRPAGSGMSQSSTVVGTYGQTSPQPIVTAQSACNCISTDSRLGLRRERSIPISRITSTTSGQIWRAGSEPADSPRQSRASSARTAPAPSVSGRRCGCRRTARTSSSFSSLCRGDQLLGVLARQSGCRDFACDCLARRMATRSMDARTMPARRPRGSRTRRAGRRPWAYPPNRS